MQNRKVTKGVITAAGYGTRFLPASKNVPKELLPLIDTPIIHYVVEEFVKSGIKDIIIITRYGNHAIEDYFDSLFELEHFLKNRRKLEKLEQIRAIYKMANFAFVRQNKDLPYGNASPLYAAKPYIGNSSFAFGWGDDITISKVPVIKQLKNTYENSSSSGVIAVQEIPVEEMHKYGSVKLKKGSDKYVEKIIEKPEKGKEFSNLASFGRYIFSPKIFKYLDPNDLGKDNEFWLVDVIHKMLKDHNVIAQKTEGKWMTTGDPLRYLETTFELALKREDLKEPLINFIKEKLGCC